MCAIMKTRHALWFAAFGRIAISVIAIAADPTLAGAQSADLVLCDRVAADPEILKLGEPYDRETQAWLSRAINSVCADPARLAAGSRALVRSAGRSAEGGSSRLCGR